MNQKEEFFEYINSGYKTKGDFLTLGAAMLGEETITDALVKVPLKTGGKNIAYIMGAGDKMPESLGYVGYNVNLIETSALNTTDLSKYDAVVIGIRAYNTNKSLKLYNEQLFEYAEKGGTLITQYNSNPALKAGGIKAFDFNHPGVLLENKERAKTLFAAIEKLPENQRVAFTLHKIEGLSYQEITAIMETSLSSVESLMFRAKKNLQKTLGGFYKKNKT